MNTRMPMTVNITQCGTLKARNLCMMRRSAPGIWDGQPKQPATPDDFRGRAKARVPAHRQSTRQVQHAPAAPGRRSLTPR
jgi:hypothetical protein